MGRWRSFQSGAQLGYPFPTSSIGRYGWKRIGFILIKHRMFLVLFRPTVNYVELMFDQGLVLVRPSGWSDNVSQGV